MTDDEPQNEFRNRAAIFAFFAGQLLSWVPIFYTTSIRPYPTWDVHGVPWYDIHSDFNQGIGALTGLLLGVLIGIVMRQRFPLLGHMFLWMVLLWHGPRTAEAIYIYFRCPHILDSARAISPWSTYELFRADWFISWGKYLFMIPSLVIAFFFGPRPKRKTKSDPVTGSGMSVGHFGSK